MPTKGRGTDATAAATPTAGADADAQALADAGEIQFFEGTIVKIDGEGREVMSDHLVPGDVLRRDTTDRYSAVRATAPDAERKAAAQQKAGKDRGDGKDA